MQLYVVMIRVCVCFTYRKREQELREQEDARLAHQASLEEQKEIKERRKREIELSEREIERLRQLQLQRKEARYGRCMHAHVHLQICQHCLEAPISPLVNLQHALTCRIQNIQ